MHYRFVDQEVGGKLLARMLKGGLSASINPDDWPHSDEVTVRVLEGEEWVDEDAWVRAIEAHYACVFDDAAE